MKKPILIALFLLGISFYGFAEQKQIYEEIKINEALSRLIIRNKDDRVYSGQVKSQKGLTEFINKYLKETPLDLKINFKKDMLIFGITDNISTKAYRFLKSPIRNEYTLDYYDTGVERKLRRADKGKKHSYLQIFVVKRIDGISHIRVKNIVSHKSSKTYK